MGNKLETKATIGGILQIIFTCIFLFVIGTIFSLLTGYKSNDYPFIVRMVVWITNLILSWFISAGLLKIFFKKEIVFFNYKYMFFAYIVSVIVVWGIGFDEGDYSYVTSAGTLITIVGVIWGIKLYKKKKGHSSKKDKKELESTKNWILY